MTMEIELLNFIPEHKTETKVGYAQFRLGGRMDIWLTVLRSKKGHLFMKFPSVSLQGEFKPVISWPANDKKEKEINDAGLPLLKARYSL